MTELTDDLRLAELRELGKSGKLWRIVVLHRYDTNSTGTIELVNQTGREVMTFRENIFKVGVLRVLDPGHWLIVPPFDIISIEVWRQGSYFSQ